MLGRIAAAVAAVALLPVVAHAEAADQIKLFDDVCGHTNGKGADVIAKAVGLGFVRPPASMAKELNKEVPNGIIYWKAADMGLQMVVTGAGAIPLGDDMSGDICAVITLPADQKIEKALEGYLGVGAASEHSEGLGVFVYEEQDGKRRKLNNPSILALSKSVESGRLRFAVAGSADFSGDDKMSMLMLMIPKAK